MKWLINILLVFLWISSSQKVCGQNFEPTILVLSVSNKRADKGLEKEITEINKLFQANQKVREQALRAAQPEMESEPENIRIMYQKQLEFAETPDFYSTIPSIAERLLQFQFYERFENLLIYAVKEKSDGNIEQLSEIATRSNIQYILNFPYVHSVIENGKKITTIRVQLYDNYQEELILDRIFTGNSINPGFEFTCKEGSLTCTINNSLSQGLNEVIRLITTNSPKIIKERELANERANLLLAKYYPKKPITEVLDIIRENDTSISTEGFFQSLMNEDKTKFIGFFASDSRARNLKEIRDEQDKNVKIISDDIYNLNSIPKIYANVVIGINYNSKWYLKKDKVTYFNSENLELGRKEFFNNLQEWNFFQENTFLYNPEFWETYFFEKVKDVSKEPDYEEYYDSIYKRQERRNKGYIGIYEIVADQMRKKKEEVTNQFRKEIGEKIMRPFFEKLKIDHQEEFKDFFLINKEFVLIFPEDKSVVLNPILIEDNQAQRKIRYFVLFPETKEIFEWNYLDPQKLGDVKWHYGSEVIDRLSSLTEWNFGFETLDDQSFWEDYVLKKDDGKYKYLSRMN